MGAHVSSFSVRGFVQPLDGLDCENCEFQNVVFTYGGGLFECRNCTVSSGGLVLKGAALNTYRTLQFFGVIPTPPPADNSNPNAPKIKTAKLEAPQKVTWVVAQK